MIDKSFKKVAADLATIEGNTAWLMYYDCLCEVDLITKKAKVIVNLVEETREDMNPFAGFVKLDDKFYFYPHENASYLGIYDLIKRSMVYLPIKEISKKQNMATKNLAKFRNAVVVDNRILFGGYSYPAILCLDVITQELTYIEDWFEEVNALTRPGYCLGYFMDGHVLDGDKLYLGIASMPGILELDIQKMKSRVIHLETEAAGIGGIARLDQTHCILVGRGKESRQVMLWNMRTEKIEKSTYVHEYEDFFEDSLRVPIVYENEVYLFPRAAETVNNVYQVNLKNFELSKNEYLGMGVKPFDRNLSKVYLLSMMLDITPEGILRYVSGHDYSWHEFDLKNNTYRTYDIVLDENEDFFRQTYANAIVNKFKFSDVINESVAPLEGFLEYLKRNKKREIKEEIKRENIGSEIFKQLSQ